MIKFLVGAQGSLGATFLEWSMHYLSGQQHYYRWAGSAAEPLTLDPLLGGTAHSHAKNHPQGLAESLACMHALESSKQDLVSFYPYQRDGTTDADLDYIEIYRTARQQSWCTVYIKTDRFPLYCLPGRESTMMDRSQRVQHQIQHWQYLADKHFKISVQQWSTDEIWDWREQIALNLDPAQNCRSSAVWPWIQHTVDFSDLCWCAESVIDRIMTDLGLSLCQSRLQSWRGIYQRWQDLQIPRLWLDFNIDHLVRCVINDWEFSLPELDLFQEAMIQRQLIRDHDVNIRSWGLAQFPSCTRALHQLLEKNHHPRENFFQKFY